MSTITYVSMKKYKQEANGKQVAHMSKIVIAYLQMRCHILPVLQLIKIVVGV